MALKCVSCGIPVQLSWNVCPKCGTAITKPTPEQAKAIAKAIRAVKARLEEELDLSPEGRVEVMGYVDSVSELLDKYANLLKALVQLNEIAKQVPKVLHEKNWLVDEQSWKMNAKVVLVALGVNSQGILDPKDPHKNPQGSTIPTAPQGCAWIGAKLDGLRATTTELISSYDKFIDTQDPSALEQAAQALLAASKRLIAAADAVDDVAKRISL